MQIFPNAKQLVLGSVLALAVSPALAATTTTLTITAAGSPVTSVTSGTVVTLTATVLTGSTPVTPGRVNFCDATAAYCKDIHILGTAQLTSAGTAAIRFVPGGGSHSYKAEFAGTHLETASSSPAASLAVSGVNISATSIASSGTPANLTLTATVGGVGSAAPTGTISFLDATVSNTLLGSATLGAGRTELSFVNASRPDVPAGNSSIASADFNGDGYVDLATPDYSSIIKLLLGSGDGKFTNGVRAPAGYAPSYSLVGDFNNDSKVDIISIGIDNVFFMAGNGDGTFATPINLNGIHDPIAGVVADFDGDGNLDFAATGYSTNQAGSLVIFLGRGNGRFKVLAPLALPDNAGSCLVTGDFNGDGIPDLAACGSTLNLLLGNGDGTFTAAAPVEAPASVYGLAVADFNGDGKDDLALAAIGSTTSSLSMLLNTGGGTFAAPVLLASGKSFEPIGVGDFNSDGKADLAVANFGGSGLVLIGNGDGTFIAGPSLPGTNYSIAVADYNGDGASDLATVGYTSGYTDGALNVSLASNQTATATASGLSLLASPDTQTVRASYSGDSAYTAGLSSSESILAAAATLTPLSMSFLPTYVGDSSGYQRATLTNTGSVLLDIKSIYFQIGENFGIRERTCNASLAVGASCTFDVVFKPLECCAITDAVFLPTNSALKNPAMKLSGTGKQGGIDFVPSDLQFGPTPVGTVSGYQKVVVTNYGNEPYTIRGVEITDTTDFYSWGIREQTCGPILAAGASCTFSVVFRPTRTGTIYADATVQTSIGGYNQSMELGGISKWPATTAIDVTIQNGNANAKSMQRKALVSLGSSGAGSFFSSGVHDHDLDCHRRWLTRYSHDERHGHHPHRRCAQWCHARQGRHRQLL